MSMEQAQPRAPARKPKPEPPVALEDLVNRLTQELAHERRALDVATQKLGTVRRTMETRTQELTEARSALALLLATLDTTSDGLLAVGYFGRAMHYNTRFAEIWRIADDKLPTLNDSALLATQLAQVKDPEGFLALTREQKAQPEVRQFSVIELTDGRILECEVLPQRVRGKRVGTVTRFHDVTVRERLARVVSALEVEMPQAVAQARDSVY
jgi:PAS domain-containing protein